MSLLLSAELLMKRYKDEQAQNNERIEAYREILRSLTPQPRMSSEESELADDAATGTDPSPGEKKDIDLLEQALQKALLVRTGSEPSKKHSGANKLPGPRKELDISAVISVEVPHPSVTAKRSQPSTMKSALKPAGLDRTRHRKPGLCSTLEPTLSAGCSPGQSKSTCNKNLSHGLLSSSASPAHMLSSKYQPAGEEEKGDDLNRAASVSTPPENMEPLTCSVLQQNRRPSEQTATWKSLRSKHSRLWDKVMVLQKKPAPGRNCFMERMRALFPTEWPSGSPDQTRALLDTLTYQSHELTLLSPAEEAQSRQTPETESGHAGGWDKKFDSCVTSERLQQTTAELQTSAVKQEWKAWDRWRPEGGCLCPTGVSGVCGGGITAPLPLTVTYTTEAELQELEELRLKVALLQQEMYLEQVLLDSASPQLVEPGGLKPRVLRDVYSLLAEGGQHFPAIVLDAE